MNNYKKIKETSAIVFQSTIGKTSILKKCWIRDMFGKAHSV